MHPSQVGIENPRQYLMPRKWWSNGQTPRGQASCACHTTFYGWRPADARREEPAVEMQLIDNVKSESQFRQDRYEPRERPFRLLWQSTKPSALDRGVLSARARELRRASREGRAQRTDEEALAHLGQCNRRTAPGNGSTSACGHGKPTAFSLARRSPASRSAWRARIIASKRT